VYDTGNPAKGRPELFVDLGVAFPDMDTSPGVDLIIPDNPPGLTNNSRDQIGHNLSPTPHETTSGAVAHTYDRLRAPIYTRQVHRDIAQAQDWTSTASPEDAGGPRGKPLAAADHGGPSRVGSFLPMFPLYP